MIPAQSYAAPLPAEALVEFAELARQVGFPCDLKGLPMPVHLRNEVDPPLRQLRRHGPFDALLAGYERARFDHARANLLQSYAQIFPEQNMRNREFHTGLDRLLCYLQHRAQQGAIIESTDALDQLLLASDLHDSLPLRLFALPFPTLYLHCSSQAAQALTAQRHGNVAQVEGIYCFAGEGNPAAGGTRSMHLIALLNQAGISTGAIKFTLDLTDGDDTLLSYFSTLQKSTPPDVWEWYMRILGYVAKITLYMGLKEARVVRDDVYTAQQARLLRVGGKKQAKLERQGARLYDRIVVGPDRLPAESGAGEAGAHAVSPHWRRGHFRMQAHGPQNGLRKLMFIAPVLVAMERLAATQEAPAPKRYGVAAQ